MNYFDVLFAKKQSGGGAPTLITKTITANGTYTASEDNADGYSSVTVAVDGFKKKSIANTPTDIASFNDGTANPMPSLGISIEPVQSGSGDPSPSNVRPISGWSGANVARCGKNLFDINGGTSLIYDDVAIQNNKIVISSIGSGGTSRAYFAKTYKPGTYTFSAKMSGQVDTIRFFSPQPFTGGTYNAYYGGYYLDIINGQITVTMAEPFAIGVIGTGLKGGQGEIYDIQLELGSTATTYSPYQGSTTTIPFHDNSDNPITVYGGTLNVTSGELTVTHANIASYNGETINEPWISSMDAYSAGTTPTTGAQVVYPLATPQTYQLTPAQVSTLLGQNNIFADCGQVLEGEYFVTL